MENERFEASGIVESDGLAVLQGDSLIPKAVADRIEQQVQDKGNHPVLTINASGEIIGDVSHIPAETLEQLRSPEGRERMRAMYRKQFGGGRRALAQITYREPKEERRDFRHLCPPGMSSKEFRKLRRMYMREQTKAVVKEMRAGLRIQSGT